MNFSIVKSLIAVIISLPAFATAEIIVKISSVSPDDPGVEMGTVVITQTSKGVSFQPRLQGLSPGEHGFHIHEHPSCESGEKDGKVVAALKAGSHYDPEQTGHHEGPYGNGHKGDLPRLLVDKNGEAHTAVVAPRLTISELSGRTLMIHQKGDNYTDTPPMGGGGARIACGVIQ